MCHHEIWLSCVPKVIMHFSKLFMEIADTDVCSFVMIMHACVQKRRSMRTRHRQQHGHYLSIHLASTCLWKPWKLSGKGPLSHVSWEPSFELNVDTSLRGNSSPFIVRIWCIGTVRLAIGSLLCISKALALSEKHQKALWSTNQCDQITLHHTGKATNACLHLPMLKKDSLQNAGLLRLQPRPPRQYPAAFLLAVHALKNKNPMLIFLPRYGSCSRLQSRVSL